MAALGAMSLFACDNQPGKPAANEQTALEPIVQQATVTSRAGAHGAADPHAKLTPDKHAQVALQHLAEGRLTNAMDTLNQAIVQYPNAAELFGIRGSLWLEQDNIAAALADLESAVRLAPDNPRHLTNRAQAYRKFKRVDEALADLNRAVELDADMLPARFNRGAILFGQGDFDASLADFDHCIAVDPHAAAPYFNRAAIYDAMGRREPAIADLERFLQIAPSEEWKSAASELLQQWETEAATQADDS